MLTRRRSSDAHRAAWHVYYGDVHVGTIGRRAGAPVDVDQWSWSCGFYPGLRSGQHRYGTAATFELARAGFEADWNALLPEISDRPTGPRRLQTPAARAHRASSDKLPSLPNRLRVDHADPHTAATPSKESRRPESHHHMAPRPNSFIMADRPHFGSHPCV
jgi:hypothetical protein